MTVEELKVIISAQNTDFTDKIKRSQRDLNNFGTAADEMSYKSEIAAKNTLSSFNTLAKGIAALGLGKIIKDSITSAMDAVESENLFETSMGNYAVKARAWSEDLADALGLNAVELRKNAGIIYVMTKSMEVSEDQAYNLSIGITKLAEDMASFYNISSDEAFTKLRSGLTGETEPLKHIGILVDENTVKQYAYKTGIAEVGQELTNQQKVLGRYAAIMAQTSTAQGDLARTINSPANQLRILQNEFMKAKIEMGTAFLPFVQTVLPMVTSGIAAVTPYIASFADKISKAGTFLANLNPTAKTFLKVSLLMAAAIPMVTVATKALTLAQTAYHAMQALLIPQTITFGSVLKSAFGWVALIAGAISLLMAFKDTSDNTTISDINTSAQDAAAGLEDLNYGFDNTQLLADDTSKSISDVTDEMDNLTESVSSLAGFDELNILNIGSDTLMGKVVSADDIDNLDDFSSGIANLSNDINALQNKAQQGIELKDNTESLGQKFKNFFSRLGYDMKEGIKNGNWLPLLEDMENGVEAIFGEDWTDYWEKVGSDMYIGIHDGDWGPFLNDLDEGVKKVFGEGWTNFWHKIGEDMYKGIHDGDWMPLLNDLNSSVESLFGKKWTDFWGDVGAGMYEGIHNGDWSSLVQTLSDKVKDIFGTDWWNFWYNLGANWNDFWKDFGGDCWDFLYDFGGDWYDFWYGLGGDMAEALHKGVTFSDFAKVYEDSGGWWNFWRGFGEYLADPEGYTGYATGGFPDYGEMFIAREAGPEMVGRIGSRTAVANNDQITSAIAQAVESAILRTGAFAVQGGNSDAGDTYVFIDSEEIAARLERRSASRNIRTNGRG